MHNESRFAFSRCGLLVLGCWVTAAIVGCEQNAQKQAAPTAQPSCPQATFDAARKAVQEGNYLAFAECFSESGLDEIAGTMRVTGQFIQAIGTAPGADEKSAQLAKDVKTVVDKHVPAGTPEVELDLNAPEEQLRATVRDAAKVIVDRKQFLADLFTVLNAQRKDADEQPMKDAQLLDLTIDGDTATATMSAGPYGDQPTSTTFRLVSGQWKIDQLGRFGVSEAEGRQAH